MKKLWAAALVLTVMGALFALAIPTAKSNEKSRIERGRYLVEGIGCGDCHSPKKLGPGGPEEDLTRLLSGHPEDANYPPPPTLPPGPWMLAASWDATAWSGPWGISYPINLTPDENTGIGSWSEDTFVATLRRGRHMGVSRPILPPMPWMFYKNLSDEDLKSIYAFLRSIPPIHNRVPEPIIAPGADLPTDGLEP